MKRKTLPAWAGPACVGAAFATLYVMERRYRLRQSEPEPDIRRVPRNLVLAALVAAEVQVFERPLVARAAQWVEKQRLGLLPALNLKPGTEKVLGLVLLDYSLYWWHVLLHRVPLLWRSHQVHHADLMLDSTTAVRFHTLEFFASIPWRLAQVRLLGIAPGTLALWQRLTLLEVLFHHANLRLPLQLERWLSCFVMTPRLHGVHHSTKPAATNSNFSSGLTVWDYLHGTHRKGGDQNRIEIGTPGYHRPEQLRLKHLLTLPFERQAPKNP